MAKIIKSSDLYYSTSRFDALSVVEKLNKLNRKILKIEEEYSIISSDFFKRRVELLDKILAIKEEKNKLEIPESELTKISPSLVELFNSTKNMLSVNICIQENNVHINHKQADEHKRVYEFLKYVYYHNSTRWWVKYEIISRFGDLVKSWNGYDDIRSIEDL